jgi:hypothetical protein
MAKNGCEFGVDSAASFRLDENVFVELPGAVSGHPARIREICEHFHANQLKGASNQGKPGGHRGALRCTFESGQSQAEHVLNKFPHTSKEKR